MYAWFSGRFNSVEPITAKRVYTRKQYSCTCAVQNRIRVEGGRVEKNGCMYCVRALGGDITRPQNH